MGVSGHLSEETGDWYDIDYVAGQIVLFKNHIFNECDTDKANVYKIMKALHIPFDKRMLLDYKRLKRREKKYKNTDERYKIDCNIESRIYKKLKLWWYCHKKNVCVTIAAVSFIIMAGNIVRNRLRGK